MTRAGWTGSILAWLCQACHPATVRRAGITAVIVGVLLVAINHGYAIAQGDISFLRLFQIVLTFAVPYMVSTVSSIATRRELEREKGAAPGR
jgi:hypothetical protein